MKAKICPHLSRQGQVLCLALPSPFFTENLIGFWSLAVAAQVPTLFKKSEPLLCLPGSCPAALLPSTAASRPAMVPVGGAHGPFPHFSCLDRPCLLVTKSPRQLFRALSRGTQMRVSWTTPSLSGLVLLVFEFYGIPAMVHTVLGSRDISHRRSQELIRGICSAHPF